MPVPESLPRSSSERTSSSLLASMAVLMSDLWTSAATEAGTWWSSAYSTT